jgi:hypothetical protein
MIDYPQPTSAMHASHDQCAHHFTKTADTAQYKGSDYSNAVRVARGISLDQAFLIAENDPEVDYFMYLKGGCMVLEIPSDVSYDVMKDPLGLVSHQSYVRDSDGSVATGGCRVFHHGDAIFFKKEGKWLGSAPGLADIYFKN